MLIKILISEQIKNDIRSRTSYFFDEFVFKKSLADGRLRLAPGHWNENFEIAYLTEKMRY